MSFLECIPILFAYSSCTCDPSAGLVDKAFLSARWSHHHAISGQTATAQQIALFVTLQQYKSMQTIIYSFSTSFRES